MIFSFDEAAFRHYADAEFLIDDTLFISHADISPFSPLSCQMALLSR
jgi:hypothetical protein